MSILTIFSVSETGMGSSELVRPEPGLLGLLENCVSQTQEKMLSRVSDLQALSAEACEETGGGGGLDTAATGWCLNRLLLAGVVTAGEDSVLCVGECEAGGSWKGRGGGMVPSQGR